MKRYKRRQQYFSEQALYFWIAVVMLLVMLSIALDTYGQECYPGFVPTANDPDCDGVISIGIPLAVNALQGSDGLYYLQCTSGCAEFYLIAPIDVLYAGYSTDLDAIQTWRRLLYAYYDWEFVPLPTVTP